MANDVIDLVRCVSYLHGHEVAVPRDSLRVRKSAYAIIIEEGRLLTVRNFDTGKLFFPGGGVEPGETEEEAVERETEAETGLRVRGIFFWRTYTNRVYYDKVNPPTAWDCYLSFYVAELDGKSRDLGPGDPEEGTPEWTDLHSLNPSDFVEIAARVIQDFRAKQ